MIDRIAFQGEPGANSDIAARAAYPALTPFPCPSFEDAIADAEHNTTRFLVFAREAKNAAANNGPCVTSFVFRVRNVPAALYKSLGGFATNGVNITKLESYIEGGSFEAAMFFAEIEGHTEDR